MSLAILSPAVCTMSNLERAANKPTYVADAMWVAIFQVVPGPPVTVCTVLKVVHYSIEFHGRKEAHRTAFCLRYICTPCETSLLNMVAVFDGYENGPLKGTIHTEGQPEGK